jgi:hypothetical protein
VAACGKARLTHREAGNTHHITGAHARARTRAQPCRAPPLVARCGSQCSSSSAGCPSSVMSNWASDRSRDVYVESVDHCKPPGHRFFVTCPSPRQWIVDFLHCDRMIAVIKFSIGDLSSILVYPGNSNITLLHPSATRLPGRPVRPRPISTSVFRMDIVHAGTRAIAGRYSLGWT